MSPTQHWLQQRRFAALDRRKRDVERWRKQLATAKSLGNDEQAAACARSLEVAERDVANLERKLGI